MELIGRLGKPRRKAITGFFKKEGRHDPGWTKREEGCLPLLKAIAAIISEKTVITCQVN